MKFLPLANVQQALSDPTWDVVLLLVFLAIGFFYGLYRGKGRMAATIIYTYVALALSVIVPVQKISGYLKGVDEHFIKMGSFLILFLLLALLLGSRRGRGFRSGGSWWQVFLLSFIQVGFIIHILFSFLPADKIASLAPLTRNFFANQDYKLWWMAIPIFLVIALRRLERD